MAQQRGVKRAAKVLKRKQKLNKLSHAGIARKADHGDAHAGHDHAGHDHEHGHGEHEHKKGK
jgi:hypothetical protein